MSAPTVFPRLALAASGRDNTVGADISHCRWCARLPRHVLAAPAAARRFKERSASERVNSLLKERYGGRWALGAGRTQSDVSFDVRLGGPDGHRAVCAVVLKPATPTAGN